MDNLYFDELEMEEKFEKAILDFYKNDSRHEKNYWYKTFGNRNLKFYSSQTEANSEDKAPQFPCAIITLQSEPNTTWSNSTQIEQISRVNFTIELYTKKVGNIQNKKLCSYLSEIVTLGLRQLSGNISISKNAPIPNFDTSIYRRIVRGVFNYNNETRTIYKGD